MTYETLITTLTNEIREQRAWPGNSVGSVLTDQLWIVFGAVLAVAREVALDALTVEATDNGDGPNFGADISDAPLPVDLFFIRADNGILSLTLDGNRLVPAQFSSFPEVAEASTSPFQATHSHAHVDSAAGTVFFCHTANSYLLSYKPMPEEPTTGNYNSLEVPLREPHIKQVVELAAMHIEAVRTGNRSKSAVHKALSDYLGGVEVVGG